eukprot:2562999-Prymnesium_polylepis.1
MKHVRHNSTQPSRSTFAQGYHMDCGGTGGTQWDRVGPGGTGAGRDLGGRAEQVVSVGVERRL